MEQEPEVSFIVSSQEIPTSEVSTSAQEHRGMELKSFATHALLNAVACTSTVQLGPTAAGRTGEATAMSDQATGRQVGTGVMFNFSADVRRRT